MSRMRGDSKEPHITTSHRNNDINHFKNLRRDLRADSCYFVLFFAAAVWLLIYIVFICTTKKRETHTHTLHVLSTTGCINVYPIQERCIAAIKASSPGSCIYAQFCSALALAVALWWWNALVRRTHNKLKRVSKTIHKHQFFSLSSIDYHTAVHSIHFHCSMVAVAVAASLVTTKQKCCFFVSW